VSKQVAFRRSGGLGWSTSVLAKIGFEGRPRLLAKMPSTQIWYVVNGSERIKISSIYYLI
jgi:hypothetical protein